ncbi:MAG: ABC transporter substrate-binding protein [Eubacteriaceae bacterium]|jgi:iron complex transport system substrate-binding protein|nr:ABC transporter substrate-binding protein [Eubacteriaceae bacterium]
MKRMVLWLVIGVLILSLCSCAPNNRSDGTTDQAADTADEVEKEITLTDMMDREVTIKTPVKRVIVNQWDAAEACIAVVGEDFTDMFVGVGSSGSLKEFQKI